MSDSMSAGEERSPETSLRLRLMLPLCIAGFSGLLNVSVLAPFVAAVSAELDVSVPSIGLTATAALITTALSGLIIGWLADVAGFRRVLASGLGLLAVSGVVAASSVGFLMFISARVIGAVGFAAANGLPNAIVANQLAGVARQRALGYISSASVLAGLIGPPVLTFVGDLTSWRIAFLMVGGFAAVAGLGVRMAVPAPEPPPAPRPSVRDGLHTYATLLRDPVSRLLFVATFLQMASLIGSMVYLGAFLTDEVGLSVRLVGFAFAAQSLGGLIASFIVGLLPESPASRWYLAAIAGLGISVGTVYALEPPFIAILGLIMLAGLSQVTAWVLLVGALARHTPVGQGSTMVLNGSVLGAGGAAGSALGGMLISSSGYPALGVAFGLMAAGSGLAMWTASRTSPPDQT